MAKNGKFIVLYGINNLGKSTQARLLVRTLKKVGHQAEYVKYPIYASEPSGKLINAYLRQGNPWQWTPREFQLLHFIDRIRYEKILEAKLAKGINVVAEDYFGTAVAWGIGTGVSEKLLNYLYGFVKKEDVAILFDGKRFEKATEKNHKHEKNQLLTERVRKIHLRLGKKYGWEKIDANLTIDEIQKIIWAKIKKII